MSAETYGVIQVSGGKFHRPAETTRDRMEWFTPMRTECGATVEPLNVFDGQLDALRYCGGRTEHLCKRCGGWA